MNRTLKVLIGAALISLASLSMASAQTGSLQGARLFLYDGGIGTGMNRIGLFTPMDTSLSLSYNLTLPPNSGSAGDFLYTPDGLGTLAFTSGNDLFWRLDGNSGTTPWNGTTGSFVGTDDPTSLVIRAGGPNDIQFWNGAPSSMVMNINPVGNVGIGMPATGMQRLVVADLSGTYDAAFFHSTRPTGYALSVLQSGPGGTGITVQAGDVGIGIGQYVAPINGLEIDAQGVGILIKKWGTAPAVGISMDGSTTGLLIENSTFGVAVEGSTTGLYIRNASTSIDAAGSVEINNGYSAPVNINTAGSTGTVTIGNASAGTVSLRSGSDIMIQVPGSSSGNDLVLTGIDAGATTTKILTLDGANNVRYRTVSGGTTIITGSGTLNHIPKWTPDGTTLGNSSITDNGTLVTVTNPLTQAGGGQVTFSGNVDANLGLDVTGATNLTGTTIQIGSLSVTGAITANTTGGATTSIGNTTSGGSVNILANADITINPGAGAGDVVIPNIDLDATTTKVLTLDASNNVRYRSISAGSSILTGTGTNNTVAKWTPDGMTLGNSSITDNGTLVTVTNPLTQAGGGQVTFSGNVDANLGLDVSGTTTLTGPTTATGATNINTTGASLTVLGTVGNTVRLAANDVEMTNLPGGATTDELVTISGSDVRRVAASTFINANAWKLGGNSSPSPNIFGTTNATAVVMQTNNLTRLTLTSTGDITQTGNGQVTFSGNVDANSGLDVSGITTVNSTGGATTSIGNTTSGGTVDVLANADITINPGAGAGDLVIPNIDLDAATTKILTLDASNNVRYRSISSGSSVITGSGTLNYVARWTPDGATLGSGVITDDGSNVGISTAGTVTIASTTVNDVAINVSGGASNDLVLTGIDTDNTTTRVLALDASNNVRVHDISGGGTNIVTGSGTLNAIPKWTPDGYTLGDSKISDSGTNVTVDGTAAFNANGNVNLGDLNTDAITIKGDLKVLPIANQFAGRVMITGAPGVTTFVIPNTLVGANSIILLTLEDGSNVSNFTAVVSAKSSGVSFTVRLSSVMTPGQTKFVNYQIINQ
ncbi:MAG: hypothetical protein HYX66_09135 [Ignavibacteria bacterium]|nr:hypothetical protein [Ignavibacteria bacterium]